MLAEVREQAPQKFNANFEELGIELRHYMPDDGSGVYIKWTSIPAGRVLQMHTHTFTHKSVLCHGRAMVTAGGISRVVEGPDVLTVQSGSPHEVEALTDCVWLCIHATDETDPEMVDHRIVGG